jgi:phosphoglycerate dehydrogenase-like enzyme
MPRRRVLVSYAAPPPARDAISEELPAASVAFLEDVPERERAAALEAADAILAWDLRGELRPDELARLTGFLQLLSAGADHVPFELLSQNVTLASNVGAYARPMAEHVVAMALAIAKHLSQNHAKLARGEFDQATCSKPLRGAVVGIVGFGGIGRACADLFEAMGARIHAVNRSGRSDREVEFVGTLDDLDRVLQAADVLILSLPLTRETRGLIGRRELTLMKPDAILVNVARGAIVDEAPLYEHLRQHPDFWAGLDAWWEEPFDGGEFRTAYAFFELPNVLGSPHNSALTPGALLEATRHAARNLLRHLRGEPVAGVVRWLDYVG